MFLLVNQCIANFVGENFTSALRRQHQVWRSPDKLPSVGNNSNPFTGSERSRLGVLYEASRLPPSSPGYSAAVARSHSLTLLPPCTLSRGDCASYRLTIHHQPKFIRANFWAPIMRPGEAMVGRDGGDHACSSSGAGRAHPPSQAVRVSLGSRRDA